MGRKKRRHYNTRKGKQKSPQRPLQRTWEVDVEGESEENYLRGFVREHRDLLRSQTIAINIHRLDGSPSLNDAFKNELRNAFKNSDRAVWITDFDHYRNPNRIEAFRQTVRTFYEKGIDILILNPCWEVWILCHFERPQGICTGQSRDVINALRRYLPSYQKGAGHFPDLKERLSDAIKRAQAMGNFDFDNSTHCKAEVYRLFDPIRDALESLLRARDPS